MKYVESPADSEFFAPALGFGTYHLLDRMGEAEAVAAIDEARKAGINVVDTSDNYFNEHVVGLALAECEISDYLYLATKTGLATSREEFLQLRAAGRSADTSPERVLAHLDNSLRALGTSSIDLYQLHGYDKATPVEDVAQVMHQITEEDRTAEAYGVCNYSTAQLEELLTACDVLGLRRPTTLQPFYNMLSTYAADQAIDLARQEGMVILAHSPLLKGYLTDAMVDRFAQLLEKEKSAGIMPAEILEDLVHANQQVQRLRHYANEHGYSLSQYAIAWLTNQPQTIVLTACTITHYINEALAAVDWEIDKAGMDLVEEVRTDEAVMRSARILMESAQNTKPYYKRRPA